MGKGIVVGIGLSIVATLLGAYLFIILGCMPANADGPPPALEKWMARTSLRASINREAPKGENPQKLTDANLISGIKLYSANCAICHGAFDGAPSHIAVGLYQHAPPFMKHGVEDDPEGKIYWFVKHGVRMTGMPAFSPTLNDDQIWQITLFLKHMDALPPAAQRAWKAVPGAAKRL